MKTKKIAIITTITLLTIATILLTVSAANLSEKHEEELDYAIFIIANCDLYITCNETGQECTDNTNRTKQEIQTERKNTCLQKE